LEEEEKEEEEEEESLFKANAVNEEVARKKYSYYAHFGEWTTREGPQRGVTPSPRLGS